MASKVLNEFFKAFEIERKMSLCRLEGVFRNKMYHVKFSWKGQRPNCANCKAQLS